MLDTNKNYWLYINPHVYCVLKETQALLYNTHTGGKMEIIAQEIIALLQSLHERENLGAIYCKGEELASKPYSNFVIEFCKKDMGNIVDVLQLPEKPIQLMPVLNLQRDIEKLQKNEGRSTGEEVLHYLHEVNIYLHTACQRNCPLCSEYFRQSLCCKTTSDTCPKTLDVSILQNLLDQIRYGAVGKLNLLGGNISEYPYYKELPALLANFKERVHIWHHYANIATSQTVFSDFLYDIPVTFPLEKDAWNQSLMLLKDVQAKYHFYITNVTEYEEAEKLIEEYEIEKYAIHPIYTKENLDFFEQYVYVDKEDIFEAKPTFRRIFAHQKLNTHFFGSLTILPNGDVYVNINCSTIGNITTNTLLDIINKEMLVNTAWRKIRDMKPCSECLYQYLCASPSNYEVLIGKPNLCHIKP